MLNYQRVCLFIFWDSWYCLLKSRPLRSQLMTLALSFAAQEHAIFMQHPAANDSISLPFSAGTTSEHRSHLHAGPLQKGLQRSATNQRTPPRRQSGWKHGLRSLRWDIYGYLSYGSLRWYKIPWFYIIWIFNATT